MRRILRPLLLALAGVLVGWLLWSELEGAGVVGRLRDRDQPQGRRADLASDLARRARLRGLPGISAAESGTGRIVGRVERMVEGHGPRPLPGVKLEILGVSGRKTFHHRATTDGDGRFAFDKVEALIGYALVIRQAPWREFVRRGINVSRNRTTDIGTLLLGAPTVLAGEVVDAAGRRVGGATVQVFRDRSRPGRIDLVRGLRELQALSEPMAETRTEAGGGFQVEDLSPGRYVLRVQAPGYATVFREGVWVSADERTPRTRVILDAGAGWYGRVLDVDGRAIPDAWVVAVAVAGKRIQNLDRIDTRSDAAGRYRLDSLVPGVRYFVEAWAEGHAPTGKFSAPGEMEELDLILAASGRVAGQVVVEATGEPVADAEVMLVAGKADALSPLTRRTDAQGRYAFDAVGAGPVVLFGAKAAGHPSRSFSLGGDRAYRVVAGETTVIDVALPLGIEAEGRVLDESQQPVPYATVVFLDPRRRMEGGETALTGPDGLWRLAGLREATYEVRVQAIGFAPLVADADARVQVVAPGPLLRDFVLERGATLEGKVLSPDGAPVGGARLEVACTGKRRVRERVQDLLAISAASGAWRIAGVPPLTELCVEARHPDWASVRSAPMQLRPGVVQSVELRLGEGVNLDGRVTGKDGRALEGARVRWGRIPAEEEGRIKDAYRADRFLLPRVVRTAVDGRFRLPRLEPGRWLLKVEHEDHAPWYRKDVLVHDAGTGSVEVAMEPTLTVEGRVVDQKTGRPIEAAWLYAMEQAPSKEPQPEQPASDSGRVRALGSTQSDANGRYRIEGLPPDRVYEVVVWIAPEYRSALTDRGHASIRVRDVRAGARGVDFRLEKIGLEELSPLR